MTQRDDRVAVVSAGKYANELHLAPDRWSCHNLITQFLQATWHSWCQNNMSNYWKHHI